MKRIIALTAVVAVICPSLGAQESASRENKNKQFVPGEVWLDTSGKPIQAHGGGIIVQGKIYYWYGEDRTNRQTSVSCYSCTDLYTWKHEGVVFTRDALSADIRDTTFIERPKAVFNAKTGKYVLWMHLEQRGYHFAQAGVAVSDQPAGPFTFLHHMRPVQFDFGAKDDDPDRQRESGGTYRDMNLFVDDDGKAYAFYASEGNWTVYVVRLNDEYTGPEVPMVQDKTWSRILVRKMREAPAPFKFQNRYYLVTSGCTGWNPNAADCAVADNILGPWESKGNPCTGPEAELTFRSQSTCVLPVPGKPGCFIFMADRWMPRRLSDSRCVWLPLAVGPDNAVTIPWLDQWDLHYFDKR